MENEQADAGRDGQARLARPDSSGAKGEREILFFSIFPVHVQLITKNRIGNLINSIIRVIHTLLYTIHIYIRSSTFLSRIIFFGLQYCIALKSTAIEKIYWIY